MKFNVVSGLVLSLSLFTNSAFAKLVCITTWEQESCKLVITQSQCNNSRYCGKDESVLKGLERSSCISFCDRPRNTLKDQLERILLNEPHLVLQNSGMKTVDAQVLPLSLEFDLEDFEINADHDD